MMKHVTRLLGALLLTSSATLAQAQSCGSGVTTDHTVYSLTVGFLPETLYVCPGDRIRIQNKSAYQMRATVPSVQMGTNGELQDFSTGNLASEAVSGFFTFDATDDVVVQPQLVLYSYGSLTTYPLVITSDAAAAEEYAEGERYEDP